MQKSQPNDKDIYRKVAFKQPKLAPPEQPASPPKPRPVLKLKAKYAADAPASAAPKSPLPDAPQKLASARTKTPQVAVQENSAKKPVLAKKLNRLARPAPVEQPVPAKRLVRASQPKVATAQLPVAALAPSPEYSIAVSPSALPATALQNTQPFASPLLDSALQQFPESLQQHIAALVTPCVRQLVTEEPDPLARSFGNSIVICTVLEILVQHGLLREMLSSLADSPALEKSLARFERILKQKLSMANFLLRYKEFRRLADK